MRGSKDVAGLDKKNESRLSVIPSEMKFVPETAAAELN